MSVQGEGDSPGGCGPRNIGIGAESQFSYVKILYGCKIIYLYSLRDQKTGVEAMTGSLEITRTQFTVADFITWMRTGQLNLSPSFQRRPVWKPSAKSYLVDTVVRGLPTPIIFLRQITDTKTFKTVREVVDGQQRIRTLISYIDGAALPDWDEGRDAFTVRRLHNRELASKKFKDLDERHKQSILNYQFSTHILPNDTSDQQVLDIFRRMNATGTRLNKQELRNAEFFGEFIQSVYEVALASLDLWRKWEVFSEDEIARMDEAEFVSELYIMILSGVSSKSQPMINSFYRDYDTNFKERAQVEKRVNWLLGELDDVYGDKVANSQFSNRIILYGLLAAIYDISFGLGSALNTATPRKKIASLAKKLEKLDVVLANRDNLPSDVQEALIGRPGHKANRLALTNFIKSELA